MIVEVNGVELHCEMTGAGEPLVWLHGFMGSGADWKYIFPTVPDGYRLIAPDLRGHGASTNPSGEFTFRQAAADVLAVLRHLRIERIKAIGLSGGGIVLLHMARAQPALIESMVLVSAPPYFPEQARAIQRQASESMFGEIERDMMRKRHVRGEEQMRQLFAQARALADGYDDVSFTPPQLGTIAAETLIVFGDRDPFYPASIAFELYAAMPKAYLWVVPNGGHAPVFGERAGPFADTARAFLDGRWRSQ